MANFVVKKDGTRVPFDLEKIKGGVMAAASEAGLSDQEATDLAHSTTSLVVDTFEGQEEVSANDIRDKILSDLDVSAPSVAEAWRKYEESKGS